MAPTTDWPTPAAILNLSGVTGVAAGYQHICAVSVGTVFCWGINTQGQPGNGTTISSSMPVAVT